MNSETTNLLPSEKRKNKLKRLNALQVALLIYFGTSGGPFGLEPVIGAADLLMSLLGMLSICLVWCLPQ